MDSSESNIFVLEGIQEQQGGLIIKKKTDKEEGFKEPKASLLGLDKLASIRRQEKLDAGEAKKRHYREALDETPTHTGGVSFEAKKRAEERYTKQRDRGIHVSSKDEKRDRPNRDKYDYGRDRDRDRFNDRERERGRHRYDDRRNSERSHRSSRHPSESPRFKDEPLTPYYQMKDPISKTSWDEDEVTALKRSAWDYPTPSSDKRGDWSDRRSSHRSDRSRRYDETPRPSPAFRYNAWAKDRKKTGATPGLGNGKYTYFHIYFYIYHIRTN